MRGESYTRAPMLPNPLWSVRRIRVRFRASTLTSSRIRRLALALPPLVLLIAVFLNTYVLYALAFSYDLALVDVTLHDGLGRATPHATVALRQDRIAAVWRGQPPMLRARIRLAWYMRGLDLAPGFIDTHSHIDQSIAPGQPIDVDNLLAQGVTTAIAGNCGRSVLPVSRVRDQIARLGANLNIATLIGYNTLRARVMGDSTVPASPLQLARLRADIADAMDEGAVGISTGFTYGTGRLVTPEELADTLRVAAERGGVHASHMRDEGHGVIEAVDEVLSLSTVARIPTIISHLKITGPANCMLFDTLIGRLNRATTESRLALYADQYPYDSSSTNLEVYLPDWFATATLVERRVWLDQADMRRRLLRDLKARVIVEGFTSLDFCVVAQAPRRPSWQGRSIADLDRERRGARSTLDTQLDLVLELLRAGGAQMNYQNICSDDVTRIAVAWPTMVGTDSAIRRDGDGMPHPRGWGTFPRVLSELVRRRGLIDLDEAIRRMTALPAAVFGLADRGVIRPGAHADLVVFDAARVADRASYRDPFQRPVGIRAVWVNGRLAAGDWRAAFERIAPELVADDNGRFLTLDRWHAATPPGPVLAARAWSTPLLSASSLLFQLLLRVPQ